MMTKTPRLAALIGALLALALLAGALVGAQDEPLTFGYAVHDDPSGSFWDVVTRGVRDAADELGVRVLVGGSPDPVQQAQLVEDYIAQGVDGLIVSLANPDALRDSITRAVSAGIPVITINSGAGVFRELGALTHVGQTEFVAGQGAGLRLNELGATYVLCVLHEEGNIGLEERCAGLQDTFTGEVERFNVATTGVADLAGTQSSLQDKLIASPRVDAILALNPDVGIAARDAVFSAGTTQIVATFDLSADILRAIQNGEIAFAIDQQQYLQGYLPVVFLRLYNQNLNVVGGGNPVLTGPGFVTAENAAQVIDLSAAGTR